MLALSGISLPRSLGGTAWGPLSSMPKESNAEGPRRVRPKVSITLSVETIAWLDAKSGPGRLFAGRSDAIEWCIKHARQETATSKEHVILTKIRELLDESQG
jgi:hypothetical protein